MNHPNSFMDPIAFNLKQYPPRLLYLARGDAFKKGFVTYILDSLGIVPIFRIQDAGKEGLKKNDETFKRVNELLGQNEKIIVFAEGLCVHERRLRPIKKGPARMVFGAMDALNNPDLLVVPVGVNYSNPEKFRSFVFFNIGEPIKIRDYIEAYKENPARTMNQLTQLIEQKMKELVVHVNDKSNDELIDELQEIYKKQWIEEHQLDYMNLEHQQQFWQNIVSDVNQATLEKPEIIDNLKRQLHSYLQQLRNLKLRDHLIRSEIEGTAKNPGIKLILFVLGFPVYFIGKVLNYVPYKASELITNKVVKDIEFHSSVNAVLGSILFFISYLIELLIVWMICHYWYCLVFYSLIKISTGWFALRFSPFKRKILGTIRLKSLKNNNKNIYFFLKSQRNDIIDLIKSINLDK